MDVYAFDRIDTERIAKTVRGFESGFLARLPPVGFGSYTPHPECIPFINATGTTIPAFGVVRKTTPTTVDDEMVVNVAKVDATYRWLYIVNGPEDVETGAAGWGTYLWNAGKVLKDTATNPADGERWGPKNDSFLLWQHRYGFWVDGRYNSTEGTMLATQISPGEVRVKNDDGGGSLAAGGSGRTFGIYSGTAGTTDTGLELSIVNNSSTAWATDKYGWATADMGGANMAAPHQT